MVKQDGFAVVSEYPTSPRSEYENDVTPTPCICTPAVNSHSPVDTSVQLCRSKSTDAEAAVISTGARSAWLAKQMTADQVSICAAVLIVAS